MEAFLLGYSLESKAFRVYVIDHKKVIESLNVTFNYNKLPKHSNRRSHWNSEVREYVLSSVPDSDSDELVVVDENNGTGGDVLDTGGENHSSTSLRLYYF